jgi:hypothetical protein
MGRKNLKGCFFMVSFNACSMGFTHKLLRFCANAAKDIAHKKLSQKLKKPITTIPKAD